LLPYNYSLAWENSVKGTPLTRPLFFNEPENPLVAEIDNTYFWGPNMLVAPILEKDQDKRKLYLPNGNWFDFFDDQRFEGDRWIEKDVRLESIPVFVRGGSFITMIEPIQNTEEYSSENLIVHYWYDADVDESEFTMYEDDGKTKGAYQKNLFELLHFKARSFDDLLMFLFDREKHDYKGMPKERNVQLVIHNFSKNPQNILVDDIVFPSSKFSFDKQTKKLTINFSWQADNLDIQIRK
jgi:hypothetical protein